MLHYKQYDDYESYIKDQIAKVLAKEDYIRQKSDRKYKNFLKHFVKFNDFLDKGDRVLCLGARFGEEVRAFRDMGYWAIGLDLFASPKDKDIVLKGDWNDMQFSDGIFNCIFTNSIDHCYDLGKMIKEICRVLYRKGIVVIDLNVQHCAAATDKVINMKLGDSSRYEAMLWNDDKDVIDPFIEAGFSPRMVWLDHIWHTYLLER